MKRGLSKAEIFIIAALLLLLAAVFLLRALAPHSKESFARVDIYLDNELYQSEPLPESGETRVVIEQEDGSVNELLLKSDGVLMYSSNCKNQDCVKQGCVDAENHKSRSLGRWIICLPHRLAVEFVPNE